MGVLPVADIRTDQLPLVENVPEDFALYYGASRQTHSDNGATRSDVVESLLVAGRTGRSDDRGMRAEAVFGCLLDGRHNVLFFLEIDPGFRAEVLAQLLLGISGLSKSRVSAV